MQFIWHPLCLESPSLLTGFRLDWKHWQMPLLSILTPVLNGISGVECG